MFAVLPYLNYKGYSVNYVRNITDIDDKIIIRSLECNKSYSELSNFMIQKMQHDCRMLNLISPNQEPRVTDHIIDIINMIQILYQKGHAYINHDGDMMFNLSTYKNYGLFLKNEKPLLIIKHKKYKNNYNKKQNSNDFVLWKRAKHNEPYWSSPWGDGRPGWHIECSAMNYKIFGNYCDIHGGGSDLIIPHHENEIAQSVCAHPGPYVNFWMHTGMVMYKDKKMSKSLGNYYTIQNCLKKYHVDVIRYCLTFPHYRSKINYTEDSLQQAYYAVKKLYSTLLGMKREEITEKHTNNKFYLQFISAMNDDFNTPKAYAVLFSLTKEINLFRKKDIHKANELANILLILSNLLGILYDNPNNFLKNRTSLSENQIKKIKILIEKREIDRKNFKWKEADIKRAKLKTMGISLVDTENGTKWHIDEKIKLEF
ncbi:hypothetical protein GQX74_015780 [Glossina fuscipes]|nr:hypothetical protein GQX74_015780 [Glossina fuscipes]